MSLTLTKLLMWLRIAWCRSISLWNCRDIECTLFYTIGRFNALCGVAEVNCGCLDKRLRYNQQSHSLGNFRAQEGSESHNSDCAPICSWVCCKGIHVKGRMMWKRDNGIGAMRHYVRRFHRAMLESSEARSVTAPWQKEEDMQMMAGWNTFWAENGCKKYAVDNNEQFEENGVLIVGKGLVPIISMNFPGSPRWFFIVTLSKRCRLARRSEKSYYPIWLSLH